MKSSFGFAAPIDKPSGPTAAVCRGKTPPFALAQGRAAQPRTAWRATRPVNRPDGLAVVAVAEPLVGHVVDVLAEEMGRAVAEDELAAARMGRLEPLFGTHWVSPGRVGAV